MKVLVDPRKACYGLIVAAGAGRRFGGLKQFALLRGRPVLAHSLAAFHECRSISGYVVVTVGSRIRWVERLCRRLGYNRTIAVVPGGTRRPDSVRRGLEALPEVGIVAIHDGVRPAITPALLAAGLRAARRGPVTYGRPLTDTIKLTQQGRISRTLGRGRLCSVQTPQFFRLPLLRRAFVRLGQRDAPDDCYVVERIGLRPRVLVGPAINIKITRPEDLSLLEAWL